MDQVKLKRINLTNFLRQYESENTKKSYRTGLKQYFQLIYPSLKDRDLDSLADKYLEEERDYRVDILNFKESLKGSAPKTIKLRLNAVRVFLDDNGISFPKRFFKNLNGRVNGAITLEEIPSNDELKRIIEYMSIHGKALT